MLRTLFLQAPSFDGFDGGAGARYQARREVKSYWYPTWLAQPAALVEGSRLIDAPPHDQGLAEVTAIVAKIAGDPTQPERTWVLLTEAAEGGWGIAGTAFGREEFIALLRPKA